MYLLKGYNSIGINRSLYSLEKKKKDYLSKIVSLKKHKKSYGYPLKLLFVEPNKLGYILGTSL